MTDMIPGGEVVLKSDKLGRVRTPLAGRNEILDQFEQSGLSGVKFAELAGLKYPTLATWVRKRRAQPSSLSKYSCFEKLAFKIIGLLRCVPSGND